MKIGVLDIQGSVEEHFEALKKVEMAFKNSLKKSRLNKRDGSSKKKVGNNLSIEPVLVKKTEDLKGLKGLIIPGGESTTIGKLLGRFGLGDKIIKMSLSGKLAVWGTCAGAILIAKKVSGDVGTDGDGDNDAVNNLGLMDIEIERNAYGRQIDSFETEIEFDFGGLGKFGNAMCDVFGGGNGIGCIKKNCGLQKIPAVFIRAPLIKKVGKGVKILAKNRREIVAVREGKLLATTFHPEMTDDLRVHQYFVGMWGGYVSDE
jgi:5'-phosphate synthase pdxT subunit